MNHTIKIQSVKEYEKLANPIVDARQEGMRKALDVIAKGEEWDEFKMIKYAKKLEL